MFRGDCIIIGKSDDLGYLEGKCAAELHGGEGIGTVAVSNELKVHRQFCEFPEGHAHGKDTGL